MILIINYIPKSVIVNNLESFQTLGNSRTLKTIKMA
jgi:hypothetical protein